ncbi:MAG: ParA family protein [Betaproteobacteria bacterium]|nr:ParA family protein [Betaproteobacteria bacterium]
MPRVAVFNCKGGVGKTTTVLNLAAATARAGQSPLLMDLDPQAHLTRIWKEPPQDASYSLFGFYQGAHTLLSIEQEWPELGGLIPAHGQLMKVDTVFGKGPAILNKLRSGLDALDGQRSKRDVLIDCCPYLGVLSLNAIFACDFLLIPVSTDYLSLDAAHQVTHALRALQPVLKRRIERRYVLTRFDRRRRMSSNVRELLLEKYGDEVCTTVISENVAVAESPFQRKDVFSHQATSTGAADYTALFWELRRAGFLT